MNNLKNKFLFKLIVSMCLCLTILTFGAEHKVYADEDPEEMWGGILITPAVKLITAIADGIMEILHEAVLEQEVSLIKIDGTASWWAKFGKYVAMLVLTIALIALMATGVGAVASALVAHGVLTITTTIVLKTALIVGVAGGVSGVLIVERIEEAFFPPDIYLPVFNMTPEEIFSNEIPMFDINFFDPMDPEMVKGILPPERAVYEDMHKQDLDVENKIIGEPRGF